MGSCGQDDNIRRVPELTVWACRLCFHSGLAPDRSLSEMIPEDVMSLGMCGSRDDVLRPGPVAVIARVRSLLWECAGVGLRLRVML